MKIKNNTLQVNEKKDDIIFFGKVPTYTGENNELAQKVDDYYRFFSTGNWKQALSLYHEFPAPLQEKLLKVQDQNGLNVLQKLS